MKAQLEQANANVSKKASTMATPPPTVSGPTPKTTPAPAEKKSKPVVVPPPERPPPATEGARLNRLRRLCEKKPSGRINVPTEIHEKWLYGSKEEREAMIEELEAVNWSKDPMYFCFQHVGYYEPWILWFVCFFKYGWSSSYRYVIYKLGFLAL